MMLVSLEKLKRRIRVSGSTADADYEDMIHQASAMVIDYLKSGADSFLDSNREVEVDSNNEPQGVPHRVQAATMMLVGYLDRNRDGDPDGDFEYGYLPVPVMSMLYPLRDPALA